MSSDPLVLNLSKGALADSQLKILMTKRWFDRLTTNGTR